MKSGLLILSAVTLITASAPAQNVSLTLVPISYPIVIPDSGGTFNYLLFLTNNDSMPVTGTSWAIITPMDNAFQEPVLGPMTLSLAGGQTLGYYREQPVPDAVLPGTYTFHAYVGTYPDAWDSSSFLFEKLEVVTLVPPLPENPSPAQFRLNDPCPNPFNPETVISYQLSTHCRVSLRVYDAFGRLVGNLVDKIQEAGAYQVRFDGSGLAAGIYLARLQAGNYTAMQKLVLMK